MQRGNGSVLCLCITGWQKYLKFPKLSEQREENNVLVSNKNNS